MVAASAVTLRTYNGSAGALVDTNMWVDCINSKSPWHDWAIEQLQVCSERAPLHVNLIIYAELLVPGPNISALDELLDVYDTQRSQLPWASAALAAKAFDIYRRRGGARLRPLPDFFIGAHAAVANLCVLTRDSARHASHFPRLVLLAP